MSSGLLCLIHRGMGDRDGIKATFKVRKGPAVSSTKRFTTSNVVKLTRDGNLQQGLLTKNPLKRVKIEDVFNQSFFGQEWTAWNEEQKQEGAVSMQSQESEQTAAAAIQDSELEYAESAEKPAMRGKSAYKASFFRLHLHFKASSLMTHYACVCGLHCNLFASSASHKYSRMRSSSFPCFAYRGSSDITLRQVE